MVSAFVVEDISVVLLLLSVWNTVELSSILSSHFIVTTTLLLSDSGSYSSPFSIRVISKLLYTVTVAFPVSVSSIEFFMTLSSSNSVTTNSISSGKFPEMLIVVLLTVCFNSVCTKIVSSVCSVSSVSASSVSVSVCSDSASSVSSVSSVSISSVSVSSVSVCSGSVSSVSVCSGSVVSSSVDSVDSSILVSSITSVLSS